MFVDMCVFCGVCSKYRSELCDAVVFFACNEKENICKHPLPRLFILP